MQTRCPNPECSIEFEFPSAEADKRGHLIGACPGCGIEAAFRTIEAEQVIEKEYEKRKNKNVLTGGPERTENFTPPLSVLVEDVRSLWNVGSIFRTSDGANFEHIYLCGITGSPPRKEIEKVSLGAEQHVSWEYEPNPLVVLNQLKKKKVQIVGLEKTESSLPLSEALDDRRLTPPLCLIVGNEVSGLSPQVVSMCDIVCELPMKGFKESLNVAVAYGIAAYMISRSVDTK